MSGQGTGRKHCVKCQRWRGWWDFCGGSAICMRCVRERQRIYDFNRYWQTKRALRFPAGPLIALVEQRLLEWGLRGVCEAVGCKTDAVRQMLKRPRKTGTVNLSTVDKWATALGSHIDLLYEEAT